MKLLPAVLLSLLAVSCNRSNNQEMTLFHEDGRSKPSLMVATVLDSTSFDAPWSLSEEITTGVTQRIGETGQIYVSSKDGSTFNENPFSSNLDWMKREFAQEEFISFVEIVEHEFVPAKTKGSTVTESAANLNMAA